MAKTIELTLSEELGIWLEREVATQHVPLEQLIVQYLRRLIPAQKEQVEDPIGPLIGSLNAEGYNIGEQHDIYLGEALLQDSLEIASAPRR